MKNPTPDTFNRPLHDLRISVIDRCNFRCPYCMPAEEHYQFLKKEQWLTFEEILRLAKIFVQLGTVKVRLTGGEPLLRPNLPELISQLAQQIPELEDLALTTNGSLLSEYAKSLKTAGLKRLTVSLDTLDKDVFKTMSGNKGSLKEILQGISKAEEAGFDSIKINVVIKRGLNDHTILDLVDYFKKTKHVIRFIEYMDVGNCNHWQSKYVVTSKEIVQLLQKHYTLNSLPTNYFGEVAERYQIVDLFHPWGGTGYGEVGFISSISQPFCHSCTRARISADGKLFTCLFASEGTDLKNPLRDGESNQTILDIIKNTWKKRNDRYSELRSKILTSRKTPAKVEMFQIGG